MESKIIVSGTTDLESKFEPIIKSAKCLKTGIDGIPVEGVVGYEEGVVAGGDLVGTYTAPHVKEISGNPENLDTIPTHRKLSAENGIVVSGDFDLLDVIGGLLGTDINGKIVRKVIRHPTYSPIGTYITTFKIASSMEEIYYSYINGVYELMLTVTPKHDYEITTNSKMGTVVTSNPDGAFIKFVLRDENFNYLAASDPFIPPNALSKPSMNLSHFTSGNWNRKLRAGRIYKFSIISNSQQIKFIGRTRDNTADTGTVKVASKAENLTQVQSTGVDYVKATVSGSVIIQQIPYIQLTIA